MTSVKDEKDKTKEKFLLNTKIQAKELNSLKITPLYALMYTKGLLSLNYRYDKILNGNLDHIDESVKDLIPSVDEYFIEKNTDTQLNIENTPAIEEENLLDDWIVI